jgi:hypothetical protein
MRQFGPYEILAPIGAAGIGEVYLARDTKVASAAADREYFRKPPLTGLRPAAPLLDLSLTSRWHASACKSCSLNQRNRNVPHHGSMSPRIDELMRSSKVMSEERDQEDQGDR